MTRKVLFAIHRNERGGMQGALKNTAQIFSELGWEPYTIALYKTKRNIDFHTPTTHISTDESTPIELDTLCAEILKVSPDLIVSFSCSEIHLVNLDFPIIERVALLSVYSPQAIHQIIARSKNLVALVAQSISLMKILSSLNQDRNLPVRCIPNFVHLFVRESVYTTQDREILKVIAIARNHPVKNLKALCDVARECPSISFTIVTDNSIADIPPNISEFINIDEDKVTDLLKNSDLYINLSFKEGISNATLRAFSHGLPAILTDIDGIIWHLLGNAWVVDSFSVMPQNKRYSQNIKQIASWINQLSLDKETRLKMGQKSHQVAQHFNKQYVHKLWEDLVLELFE